MLGLSAATVAYTDVLKVAERDANRRIPAMLRMTGAEVIAYCRSFTSERRPPLRAGDPGRYAHPGHWGDITKLLSDSYQWQVNQLGMADWELVLRNVAPYAAHLEGHDGFWVLSGVADPDGPVWGALENGIGQVAPDWRVGPMRGVKRSTIVTTERRAA